MWTKPRGGCRNLNGNAITFRFHNPLCQETCRWIASSNTSCTSVSFDWLIFFLQSFLLFHVVGKSGQGKDFAGWKTCSLLSSISISGCAVTAFLPERHVLHGTMKTKILYWECFCESFQVERAKQDGNVPAWERQRQGVKLISSRRQIPNWRNGTGGIWLPPPFENLSLD